MNKELELPSREKAKKKKGTSKVLAPDKTMTKAVCSGFLKTALSHGVCDLQGTRLGCLSHSLVYLRNSYSVIGLAMNGRSLAILLHSRLILMVFIRRVSKYVLGRDTSLGERGDGG